MHPMPPLPPPPPPSEYVAIVGNTGTLNPSIPTSFVGLDGSATQPVQALLGDGPSEGFEKAIAFDGISPLAQPLLVYHSKASGAQYWQIDPTGGGVALRWSTHYKRWFAVGGVKVTIGQFI